MICTFPDCGGKVNARGLCGAHYLQQRKGKSLTVLFKGIPTGGPCGFVDCDKPAASAGFCHGHYQQHRQGRELRPLDRRVQAIKVPLRPLLPNPALPGTMLVPLTKGYFAIIDEADAAVVGAKNWCVSEWKKSRTRYAVASGHGMGRPRPKLHRFLWKHWGLPETPEIDHENRDGLDCRRLNLRAATHAQNMRNRRRSTLNTTGYIGVTWDRVVRKYAAQIAVDGKHRVLGHFDDPARAARFYDDYAKQAHGEFASLNSGAVSQTQKSALSGQER